MSSWGVTGAHSELNIPPEPGEGTVPVLSSEVSPPCSLGSGGVPSPVWGTGVPLSCALQEPLPSPGVPQTPQHLSALQGQICRRCLHPPAWIRWGKISHKEQLLLLSYWNTRRINDLIFHVESDLNYLQNSHQDSQPGVCFFSLLFSFPSLTLKADAPSPMDSAVPFPHAQDTLGPEPSPALPGPVPLSCPLFSPARHPQPQQRSDWS